MASPPGTRSGKTLEQILRETTVDELLPSGPGTPCHVITLDASATVETFLMEAKTHHILSVPVKDSAQDNKILGLVDMIDLANYVCDLFERHEALAYRENEAEEKAKSSDELIRRRSEQRAALAELSKQFLIHPLRELVDYSKRDPWSAVAPGTSLYEVVGTLASGVHRVPVVDASGNICNIISQSSIVKFLSSKIRSISSSKLKQAVGELSCSHFNVITISAKDKVLTAFRKMKASRISSLAVIDDGGRLLGSISVSDLKEIVSNSGLIYLLHSVEEHIKLLRASLVEERAPSIDCQRSTLFETVISKLAVTHVHRLYIIDPASFSPVGIISLTNIMKELLAA